MLMLSKTWEEGARSLLAKLSRKADYMAPLLIVYVIADFVLTPLGGLETRPVSKVTTVGLTTLDSYSSALR